MMNYTFHADIGLTLDKPTNMNYRLSLPNKVFDYMHTQTAVVATEIKEVAHVIRTNEIGEILQEFTIDKLAETINALFADSEQLAKYKANCLKAAQVENWENETKILDTIYKGTSGT